MIILSMKIIVFFEIHYMFKLKDRNYNWLNVGKGRDKMKYIEMKGDLFSVSNEYALAHWILVMKL